MSIIKRSVQRNGKTYYQVKRLHLTNKDTEAYEARDTHKEVHCFMCINNAKAGKSCPEYHKNSPKCTATEDLIFISGHSLKRYIKMAVIERMEGS